MFFIHVLRVKCEPLPQANFLTKPMSSIDIISRSLRSKPTAHVGSGSEWHLGNVETVEADGIGFAMGRTAFVKSPQFDERTHDFLEEEVTRAPFTVGVFDQRHQVCGIVRKSGVSQNADQIAAKLATLLNSASFAREANSVITVDPVRDPATFIESLRSAYTVTRFSFYASRPNPHDVDRLIQRPAEEFTQVAGGERTKVEVEGQDLDRDVLEELSKAVASVGETAAASVRPEERSHTKRVYLTGNAVTEPITGEATTGLLSRILKSTREAYDRIRHSISV
jgi:hypothetical protein